MDAPTGSPGPGAPDPGVAAARLAASAIDDAARPTAGACASVVGAALQTWLRYLVPLTLLSAIALSPLIAVALATRTPPDLAATRAVLARGWTLLAVAWFPQLLLVGAASPATRRPSQRGALSGGLAQLVRAILPCIAAAAAVAIGSLAVAVPGVILLVLLSLTAASRERGLSAPLLDSVAAVRRDWRAVALTVAAVLAIDAAIGLVAYRAFVPPLPRQPTALQLAGLRGFVRAIAAALVVVSPLPATVLATIRARLEPPSPAAT